MIEHLDTTAAAAAGVDEAARVLEWREQRFLQLGADPTSALELAHTTVDLHQFQTLVDNGCHPLLAADILA